MSVLRVVVVNSMMLHGVHAVGVVLRDVCGMPCVCHNARFVGAVVLVAPL